MKKVIYHHRIASKDGQFVHVEEIVSAMRRTGADVVMVSPSVNNNADFGSDGGFVSKLKKCLPKSMYEILELSYSFWAGAKLLYVVKKHKPDFIYERYNLHQPAGVLVSMITRTPLLLEVNAPLYEERLRHSGGIALKWLAKAVENFTWKHATVALPVTEVLSQIMNSDLRINNENIVIHNGIRESEFERLSNMKKDGGDVLNIGFVGFMHLTCGVEHVINLMAENKSLKAKLTCVGDGPRARALEEMSSIVGVSEQCDFKGLISREAVFDVVSEFDIAIQPAVTSYASPLKIFEYMAAGCLIVAPDQPNIREILNEDCAIFFTPGDIESFKSAIKEAVNNYSAHQAKKQYAREQILSRHFTWESNVKKIFQIAEKVRKG